jgi:hypothetical protein
MLRVTTATLATVLSALPFAASASTHCAADEVVYFSCKIKGSSKVVSLCGSELLRPDTRVRREDAWLQYRFGRPGQPELVYPTERAGSLNAFTGEHVAPYDDSVDTVWFKHGSATYGVEVRNARNKFYGVWVGTERKNVELPCDGLPDRWLTTGANGFFSLVSELGQRK